MREQQELLKLNPLELRPYYRSKNNEYFFLDVMRKIHQSVIISQLSKQEAFRVCENLNRR